MSLAAMGLKAQNMQGDWTGGFEQFRNICRAIATAIISDDDFPVEFMTPEKINSPAEITLHLVTLVVNGNDQGEIDILTGLSVHVKKY